MATDFRKKLKAANAAWASAKSAAAEQRSGRFTEFEDGRYMMRLVDGKVTESQSSGRLQVQWDFKFEEGEYEGQSKYDYSGLESEQNLKYLAVRLVQLGYEAPDSLEEIEDVLADIRRSKPLCRVRLKTKGEFQNVYLDKVFPPSGEDIEEQEDAAPAPADEETEEAETEAEETEEVEAEVEEEVEEEEVAEDEADDSVELTVGMMAKVQTSKGPAVGEVIEILDQEDKVRVRLADGKVIRVGIDKIEIVDVVPEEPKAPPKAAPKKGKK